MESEPDIFPLHRCSAYVPPSTRVEYRSVSPVALTYWSVRVCFVCLSRILGCHCGLLVTLVQAGLDRSILSHCLPYWSVIAVSLSCQSRPVYTGLFRHACCWQSCGHQRRYGPPLTPSPLLPLPTPLLPLHLTLSLLSSDTAYDSAPAQPSLSLTQPRKCVSMPTWRPVRLPVSRPVCRSVSVRSVGLQTAPRTASHCRACCSACCSA